MALDHFEYSGFRLSSIGLGCSRLGSITGATPKEAEALIEMAIDHGVTFFDTASSYGQGDSERTLGRLLARNDTVCLVTKVGKQVPLKAKLIQPVKGLVRKFTRGSRTMTSSVKKARGRALPVCFDPAFLRAEMAKSHRRLGMETIPMLMLHSVPAEVLKQGDAMDVLAAAKSRGDVRIIGASVDDLAAAEATLADPRIECVQVPYYAQDTAMANWAASARAAGKLVIAREIFDGIAALPSDQRQGHIKRNLTRVTSDSSISVSLVGTTKTSHFDGIIQMSVN